MTRFISIDPSSTFTGWAVFEDQGLVAWGKIDVRGADYAARFPFIVRKLAEAIEQYGAQEVAIEDVKTAWRSKYRIRNIAGLQVVFRSIQEWAEKAGLPFAAYNPATWKNAVVGHVHAPKEVVKNNVLFRFPRLPDDLSDHVYDSIAIGVYHGGLRFLEGLRANPGPVVDKASPADRLALAKTGMEALVDEATGYQDVREQGALKERFQEHRKGGKSQ